MELNTSQESLIKSDNSYKVTIFEKELTLLPCKALYIEKHRTLIVSDIHLGKVGHFRNAGIAVPRGLAESDLLKLDTITREYEVNDMFILGDMFHSGVNYDIRFFHSWRDVHHDIDITLVKGNHDIMSDEIYSHFDIKLYKKYFLWERFLFTHKPVDENIALNGCDYVFSGHLHPGVKLVGKGKQSVSLPCFHFTEKQCVLPAFGEFTGKHIIKPNGKDRIFVITKNEKDHVVLKVDKN